jgi:phage tail sheath protein FI
VPEYLAPGVFVEETSFRAKSIEGVSTSTTGFVGATRTGPVAYGGPDDRPSDTGARLVTSFTEFERVFGSIEPLVHGATDADATSETGWTAHAARAFFANGGRRLYVQRVFQPRGDASSTALGLASFPIAFGTGHHATWVARWPGAFGNARVTVAAVRSADVAFQFDAGDPRAAWGVQARQAVRGSLVEVRAASPVLAADAPLDPGGLRIIEIDEQGHQTYLGGPPPGAGDAVRLIELRVQVEAGQRDDTTTGIGAVAPHPRPIERVFDRDRPEDEDSVVWLDVSDSVAADASGEAAIQMVVALIGSVTLSGGNDGVKPPPAALEGQVGSPDDPRILATGLANLAEVDDIAIVALPDAGTYGFPNPDDEALTLCRVATQALISHAEDCRYRIAVVDPPARQSLNGVRQFRSSFDSSHAAMYHPWIEILDPLSRASVAVTERLLLPPSGFVTGIYARNDVERGVHKAPANEIVRGLTRFEVNVNTGRQEVLNPEGINALRFLEGRGNRVWGARTMSSDPEWRYVNVRRFFAYLEHSIDKATQWAVFEPNGPRLWANVRTMVEDFLLVQWRDGALLGSKPEEAYFVRCDRTTMTQNDLDSGRLVCLVGVAPVKPAEFVIFRVGQWTADASA